MATFVGAFTPGHKAGGPIRSVDALTTGSGLDVHYAVVTADRDLGDNRPYPNVPIGRWTQQSGREVLYVDDRRVSAYLRAMRLVRTVQPDVYYLNSLWNRRYTLFPMVAMLLGLLPRRPVVIAPRGELLPGAFTHKQRRKALVVVPLRLVLSLLDPVVHCTTTDEIAAAERILGQRRRTVLVPDTFRLPAAPTTPPMRAGRAPSGALRVLFVSRIDPKKNLLGAIRAVAAMTAPAELRVVGPITDAAYGAECSAVAATSPVPITFTGSVGHDEVAEHLRWADVFLLPTKGENFGHVIREALAMGVPVLTSRRTPWTPLLDAVGLEPPKWADQRAFTTALDKLARLHPEAFERLRHDVFATYQKWERSQVGVIREMERLFIAVAGPDPMPRASGR